VCQNIPKNLTSEQEESQAFSEEIDDLNNPHQSQSEFYPPMGEIILRPIQKIVVPIQYPDFFDKLKAFVEMGSDFLKESEDEVNPIDIIDVPTVETSKIIENDPH
jgi:hypothetical protein